MEVTIVLKVKDVEIKLSVEEAKKLAEVLVGLTADRAKEIVYPWYPWGRDWIYPYYTTTASTWDINDEIHVYSQVR